MYQGADLIWRPVYLNGTRLQVAIGSEIRELSPDDVIVADGFPNRAVILINGQFIGPTIEVMEGAQVGEFIAESEYFGSETWGAAW